MSDTRALPGSHPSVTRREPGGAIRVLRGLLAVAALWVAALLALGALGRMHPAGDSFAVLRVSLVAAGLAVAALLAALGAGRAALLAGLAPGLGLLSLVPHWAPERAPVAPGSAELVLYQKNLLYALHDPVRIRDDILRARPDVVTLEELHRNNERILAALREAYPWNIRCRPRLRAGYVAVLSRFPFREGSAGCSKTYGMAHAVVEAPDGPVTVGAIHFEWPWPHGQAAQAEGIVAEVAALEAPVVLGGDFNMVRWSDVMERIEAASGTEPVGPARVTFPVGPGGFSIDHVLAPGGQGQTTLRPLLGSDHLGVLAEIALPKGRPAEPPVLQAQGAARPVAQGL